MKNSSRSYFVTLVALLCCAALCTGAFAASPDHSGFAAVKGVTAQSLSTDEMQAISGQLNAYDIAADLKAAAASLAKFPRLQEADLKLAAYYLDNATAINAAFAKLGVLTPCKSCGGK